MKATQWPHRFMSGIFIKASNWWSALSLFSGCHSTINFSFCAGGCDTGWVELQCFKMWFIGKCKMSEKHHVQPVTKTPFVSQSHDGSFWKADVGKTEVKFFLLFFFLFFSGWDTLRVNWWVSWNKWLHNLNFTLSINIFYFMFVRT